MKRSRRVLTATLLALSTIFAISPAEAATFTWSSQPLTNLKAEGAQITGAISNFPTKAGLYIQQCAAPAVADERPTNCLQLAWVTATGAPPSISASNPISFKLLPEFNGKLGAVNCQIDKCGVFFSYDHNNIQDRSEDTFIPISFQASSSSSTLKKVETVTVTMNGVTLIKNVPGTLAYRSGVKISAVAASGLPVSITSSNANCSFKNGVLLPLTGKGFCAVDVKTDGNETFDSSSANYPFMLTPGTQKISISKVNIAKGKTKSLPAETNFGETVRYKSNSKNCRVELNLVEVKGACTLTATAPAKDGMWSALKSTIKVKIK